MNDVLSSGLRRSGLRLSPGPLRPCSGPQVAFRSSPDPGYLPGFRSATARVQVDTWSL